MTKQTNRSAEEPVYRVVWPLGKAAHDTGKGGRPVSDLGGKTVCELWDGMFRGDEMFPLIREQLGKRYPDIKFVDYTVFGDTHGPNERGVIAALPDLLREHRCDVVISGVGA